MLDPQLFVCPVRTSLDFFDFWPHLTSVAVWCCFAVNPFAVPYNSLRDTKAAGS